MFDRGTIFDAGSDPKFFGVFSDFLHGGLTDSTGGTAATTVADLTSSYSEATAEAAVAELIARANLHPFSYAPSNAAAVASIITGNGGWARVTTAATDNQGAAIIGPPSFVMTTNMPSVFKTKVQLSDATQSSLLAGFYPIDSSLISNLSGDLASQNANWIGFYKADGGTDLIARVRVGGANTFSATLKAAGSSSSYAFTTAATRLGFRISPQGGTPSTAGLSQVEFIVDGNLLAIARNINLPSTSVYLAPTLGYANGEAAIKTFDADYLGAAQDRY